MDLNKDISKWIHQGEQIILMDEWNIEASEVNTSIETQGLTNAIYNIHRY